MFVSKPAPAAQRHRPHPHHLRPHRHAGGDRVSADEHFGADVLLAAGECSFDAAPRRMVAAAPRTPLDPNLPPDHPLEPGSHAGFAWHIIWNASSGNVSPDRCRRPPIGSRRRKPPSTGRRRRPQPIRTTSRISSPPRAKAAQAAAAAPPDRKANAKKSRGASRAASSPAYCAGSCVAGGAVVVAALFVHVVLHMFQDNSRFGDFAAAAAGAFRSTSGSKRIPRHAAGSDACPACCSRSRAARSRRRRMPRRASR